MGYGDSLTKDEAIDQGWRVGCGRGGVDGCVWGWGVAGAQAPDATPKTMLALPPAPLLPQTLGKLTRVAEGDSGDGLGGVDVADTPVLTEDGLKRFARSDYAAGTKGAAGSVTVYKFGDASGGGGGLRLLPQAGDAGGEAWGRVGREWGMKSCCAAE